MDKGWIGYGKKIPIQLSEIRQDVDQLVKYCHPPIQTLFDRQLFQTKC